MKNKLEVGMYVRTNKGIKKIEDYNYHKELPDNPFDFNKHHIYKQDIINASHNIIDLIEVGDYVNGYKVLEIYTCISGEKVCKIQTEYKTKDELLLPYETPCVTEKYIKSIVTKEQFKSLEYEVKEC